MGDPGISGSKGMDGLMVSHHVTSYFSLQYQDIVKQTGDENKENHQLENIVLM